MKKSAIVLCIVLAIVIGLASCRSGVPKQPLPVSSVYHDYLGQDMSVVIEKLGEPNYTNKRADGGAFMTYPRSNLTLSFDLQDNRVAKVIYSTRSEPHKKDIRSKVMDLHGNGKQWNTIEKPSKPWLANKTLVMELADHSRLIYEDKVNLTVSSVDKL